jgi:hypothetical protein
MARTNLGRIRTVFKGEWAAGDYVIDDVVSYAGSTYTCIAIAAAGDDPTNAAFWIQSTGGTEFVGVWDTSTTYKVNQIVTFNGSTYIAITAHSATEPTTSGQTDWAVIAGGFQFEGVWNIGTTYQINDIATFNGSTYIAITNHSATEPTTSGQTDWNLMAGGFKFEGAWDTALTYQINDIVIFNGSTYISLTNHTGTQPTATGQTDWNVFSGGLNFLGAWLVSITYHKNDVVTLNGSAYIAIDDQATFYTPVPAGNAGWVLFASGGDIADQTGNTGKILSTDGTGTSWIDQVDPTPDQSGQANKVLKTDGSVTSWSNVGVTELGITDGSSGDYLSTNGSGTLSFVTPSSGGGGGWDELWHCTYSSGQQWGFVCIPSANRGKYKQYKIVGTTCCYSNYCSMVSLKFAAAPGCTQMDYACWCCAQCSCGIIHGPKCESGTWQYTCGGSIPWIFGCDGGCMSSCTAGGFSFEFDIWAQNPCNMDCKGFWYHNQTFGGNAPGGGEACCRGIRNDGRAINCCGGHPTCLCSMCFSTQSQTVALGNGGITIYGIGKLD